MAVFAKSLEARYEVLSWQWRCSWSSTDRRCSNNIWLIDNFIAYQGSTYIRGLTVFVFANTNTVYSFVFDHPCCVFVFDHRIWRICIGFQVQSTPFISRLLGAKIRERELSGSPVISRFPAKAATREFRMTDPHSGVYNSQTVCWAIIEVLMFPGSLHTST